MTAAAKRRVAEAAAALVEPGMRVGLGTGSTAAEFVKALAARRLNVVCVATSSATHALASQHNLRLLAPEEAGALDLAIDGADEIDPALNLIKGGGAALLREKIVAAAARRFIVIADAAKPVATLGRFPLPVEVAPFGWTWTAERVRAVLPPGAGVSLRRDAAGAPILTDGGHVLLDCACGAIPDPAGLATALDAITGVMEHGLFVAMAQEALIADDTDVRRLLPRA